MDLTLTRKLYSKDGVFGELTDESGKLVAVTLEHAYDLMPKVPAGTYACKRGPHRLASMEHDFTTFEIEGVPDHSKILFHVGNYNHDSQGCVLLGHQRVDKMVTESKLAFARFMELQTGVNTFHLIVK